MIMETLDLDLTQVAELLEKFDGDELWTVDGLDQLASSMDLPCDGRQLANALRELPGRVRVFGTRNTSPKTFAELSETDEPPLVVTFALLEHGSPSDQWIIMQDTTATAELKKLQKASGLKGSIQ